MQTIYDDGYQLDVTHAQLQVLLERGLVYECAYCAEDYPDEVTYHIGAEDVNFTIQSLRELIESDPALREA